MTTSTLTPAPAPSTLRQAWLALGGLSAVFLFEMLDNSILNVALPTIGRELQASTIALQWVTNSYAVVFGGLMLVFGAVADRFVASDVTSDTAALTSSDNEILDELQSLSRRLESLNAAVRERHGP